MKKYESGGLIKSKEVVRGDSPLNDNKTIKVSGGEIVVKKSVVEKGLPAIMEFVKNELSKSSHEDKKNYDSGGTVNQKYIDLANYFNGGAQEAPTKGASAQQKVVTPPNQRIKELDAVRTNLRPLNSSEQQEYNTLTATQSAGGYAEGGTVPEDFDPDKYIAEKTAKIAEKTAKSDDNGFDPDKYIAEKSAAQSQPEMSQGKAALTGLQSGAAMGARPFISGLAAGAGGGVGAYQMAREKGKGLLDSAQEGLENAKKSFHQGKVEANEEEATAAHEYPKTYLASQLGGGALTVPFTPGGLAGAVGTGAGIGAANTLSENDPTIESGAKNIAGGAALGAAAHGAAKLVGYGVNALKNSADAAQEIANTQAVRAAGGNLKDVRSLTAKGRLDDVGQFALDNGIVKAGDTADSIAQKASSFRKKAGESLDDIYEQAKKVTDPTDESKYRGFNPTRDKDAVLNAVDESLGDQVGKESGRRKVESYLDQLATDHGDEMLDPRTANNVKTEMDKEINYSRNPFTKNPPAEKAFTAARQYINDAVKRHIQDIGEETGNMDLATKLSEANKKYGFSKQLEQMAEDKVNRETANRIFGLTDTIAGAGAAGAGGALGAITGHGGAGAAIGAAAGAVGNKLARTYGPGVLASGANAAAKIAPYTAEPVGNVLSKLPGGFLKKTTTNTGILNATKKDQ